MVWTCSICASLSRWHRHKGYSFAEVPVVVAVVGWCKLRQRLLICRTIDRPLKRWYTLKVFSMSTILRGECTLKWCLLLWRAAWSGNLFKCNKISLCYNEKDIHPETKEKPIKDALMQVWICLEYNPPTNSSISSSSLPFSCHPTHIYCRNSLIPPVLLQWNTCIKQFKSPHWRTIYGEVHWARSSLHFLVCCENCAGLYQQRRS